ncbi:aromatic ring-opening dioxygenase LigA [Streptomyces sp. 16-176A]
MEPRRCAVRAPVRTPAVLPARPARAGAPDRRVRGGT